MKLCLRILCLGALTGASAMMEAAEAVILTGIVSSQAEGRARAGKLQEWAHPIPWYGPYGIAPDKEGWVWSGAMSTDLIARFNPRTREFRKYLMPRVGANVRRVDASSVGARPVFWVGENHQAKIAKVEPLD